MDAFVAHAQANAVSQSLASPCPQPALLPTLQTTMTVERLAREHSAAPTHGLTPPPSDDVEGRRTATRCLHLKTRRSAAAWRSMWNGIGRTIVRSAYFIIWFKKMLFASRSACFHTSSSSSSCLASRHCASRERTKKSETRKAP